MTLFGKTALVTGSTSGIGFAIAQALASKGCQIILNGLGDPDVIQNAIDAITDLSQMPTVHLNADLSDSIQINAMMGQIFKKCGGVDILVNNAGIQHVAPLTDFPTEKWDAILAINLSSAFHTIKAAIPPMRDRKWGRIINIASAHGLVGSPEKSAYVAAKHGIVGLTKVAALECATMGITVNAICPGWVLTPLVQKQIDEKSAAFQVSLDQAERDLLDEKQPSHRFIAPDDVAEMVLFLCTPAGASITGSALSMDGGWTAQ